jgi:hypothetical protein
MSQCLKAEKIDLVRPIIDLHVILGHCFIVLSAIERDIFGEVLVGDDDACRVVDA